MARFMPAGVLRAFFLGIVFSPSLLLAQDKTTEPPLVRVTVDLIQLEAVVTDAKGSYVTDLTSSDFLIRDNGAVYPVEHFQFVPTGTFGAVNVNRDDLRGEHSVLPSQQSPQTPPPSKVKRSVVMFVDDLRMSNQSFASVHAALEHFVEQQMGDADLAAIVSASGQIGNLQQMTSDRRILRAAVEKLRSVPNHRIGIGDEEFSCYWFNHQWSGNRARLGGEEQDEDAWLMQQPFCPGCRQQPQDEMINDHRNLVYSSITLAALRRTAEALRELPGQKAIVFFSEGIPLQRAQGLGDVNHQLVDSYNALLMEAGRSGVSLNTIDPRGVVALTPGQGAGSCAEARNLELSDSQLQLAEMAHKTAGLSVVNDNDLPDALNRILNEPRGYYLISYRPNSVESKIKKGSPKFRNITLQVRRPGLVARYHSSLYAEKQQDIPDRDVKLSSIARSAFPKTGIRLQLNSTIWCPEGKAHWDLDAVLHIDSGDLTFTLQPDGRYLADFDVFAGVYASDGKQPDNFEKRYKVSLSQATYQKALKDGIDQALQFSLPGPWQVRVAARDRQTRRLGSTSSFFEVPEIENGRFALSGIALTSQRLRSSDEIARTPPVFGVGQTVYYAFEVLNPKRNAAGGVDIGGSVAVYRNGVLVAQTTLPKAATEQANSRLLIISGSLRLGNQLPQGGYTLLITAIDHSRSANRGSVTQTST